MTKRDDANNNTKDTKDLADIDRKTFTKFAQYMQQNPFYFESIFGAACTLENIKIIHKKLFSGK